MLRHNHHRHWRDDNDPAPAHCDMTTTTTTTTTTGNGDDVPGQPVLLQGQMTMTAIRAASRMVDNDNNRSSHRDTWMTMMTTLWPAGTRTDGDYPIASTRARCDTTTTTTSVINDDSGDLTTSMHTATRLPPARTYACTQSHNHHW